MIKNSEHLSMVEAEEYIKKIEDGDKDLIGFIKKFSKLKLKEAEDLKKKLEDLNLMKIRPEHIAKIIDFMPETSEDLNKIFVDFSLDEDEKKKILDTIKEFR